MNYISSVSVQFCFSLEKHLYSISKAIKVWKRLKKKINNENCSLCVFLLFVLCTIHSIFFFLIMLLRSFISLIIFGWYSFSNISVVTTYIDIHFLSLLFYIIISVIWISGMNSAYNVYVWIDSCQMILNVHPIDYVRKYFLFRGCC